MSIYIGIDPGQKGAIAVMHAASVLRLYPMPLSKPEIDGPSLATFLEDWDYGHAYIEKQMVLPKQGIVSGFRCGCEYGRILGILVAMKITYSVVPARTWKAVMLPGENKSDKSASVRVCKALFPNVSLRRTAKCRTDDHNMAEALLLAEYGRRTNEKG